MALQQNIDNFLSGNWLSETEDEIKDRFELTQQDFKEIHKDVKKFFSDSKEALSRWTTLLAQNSLTKSDYEWLVFQRTEVLKNMILREASVRMLAVLDRLVNALLEIIIKRAFAAL